MPLRVAVLQKHILSGTQISFGIPSGFPEISTLHTYTNNQRQNSGRICKVGPLYACLIRTLLNGILNLTAFAAVESSTSKSGDPFRVPI